MGLDYPPWGETDRILALARARLRAMVCPCGCGQWADEAHDPASKSEWWVDTDTCYAGAALAQFHKDNPEPPDGQLVVVRRGGKASADASDYERLKAMIKGA